MRWLTTAAGQALSLTRDQQALIAIATLGELARSGRLSPRDLALDVADLTGLLVRLADQGSNVRDPLLTRLQTLGVSLVQPIIDQSALITDVGRLAGQLRERLDELRVLDCTWARIDSRNCDASALHWRGLDQSQSSGLVGNTQLRFVLSGKLDRSLMFEPRVATLADLPASLTDAAQLCLTGSLAGDASLGFPIRLGRADLNAQAETQLRLHWLVDRGNDTLVATTAAAGLGEIAQTNPFDLGDLSQAFDRGRLRALSMDAGGRFGIGGSLSIGVTPTLFGQNPAASSIPASLGVELGFHTSREGRYRLSVYPFRCPTTDRPGIRLDIHRTEGRSEHTSAMVGLTLDLSHALEGLRGDLIRYGKTASGLLDDLEVFIPPSAAVRAELGHQIENRVQSPELRAVLEDVLGASAEVPATVRLRQRLEAELDARADLWSGQVERIATDAARKVLESLQLGDASTNRLSAILTEVLHMAVSSLRARLQGEVKRQLAESVSAERLQQHLAAAEASLGSGFNRLDGVGSRVQAQLSRFQVTLSRLVKALQQSSEIKLKARWRSEEERARGLSLDQSLWFMPDHTEAAQLYRSVLTGSLDDAFRRVASKGNDSDGPVKLLSGTLQEVASLKRKSGFELTLLDFQLGSSSILDSDLVIETDTSGNIRVCTKATSRWRCWRPRNSIEVETINVFELATLRHTRHMSLSASLSQVDANLTRAEVREFFKGLMAPGIALVTDTQESDLMQRLPADEDLGRGELRAWLELSEPQIMALLRIRDPGLGLEGNRLFFSDERHIIDTAIDAMLAGMRATGSKTDLANLAHALRAPVVGDDLGQALKSLRSSNLRARHGVDETADGAWVDKAHYDRLERIIQRAEGMLKLIEAMRRLYFSTPGPGWSSTDYQALQADIDDIVRLWVKGEPADRGLSRLIRGANDIGPYLLGYFKTLAELCRPRDNNHLRAQVQASLIFPDPEGPEEIRLLREAEPAPLPTLVSDASSPRVTEPSGRGPMTPPPTDASTLPTPPGLAPSLWRTDSMSALIFPLENRISTYHQRGARFGTSRPNGRLHAGCDLIAKPNTRILAMADGQVVRGPYLFYSGTYALEVEHEYENGKTILVRYGEISQHVPQGISAGKKVACGQVIAKIGQLNSGSSMLHLEMYSNGQDHSKLTVAGTKYKRRADLLDPTETLDKAPTQTEQTQRTGSEDPSPDRGGGRGIKNEPTPKHYTGIVNNRVINQLNVRQSAIIDRSVEPVARLRPSERVEVLRAVIGSPYPYGQGNLWYEVRLMNRGAPIPQSGFVVAYFIDTDYPIAGACGLEGLGAPGYVSRLQDGLNIREQPSIDAPVKATLDIGTKVEVLAQVSGGRYGSNRTDWLHVRYDKGTVEEEGYAAAFYIDIGTSGGTHDPTEAQKDDLNRWERVLLETEWGGCSTRTANAELPGMSLSGAEASRRIADKDVEAVKQMAGIFHDAAARFGVPAAVLAGIASRESHVGKVLVDGWGDRHHGFGVMQVDVRSHGIRGRDPRGLEHVEQAAGIFDRFLQQMLTLSQYRGWEDRDLLLGATAAYNFGIANVRNKERIDIGTTHDDYGSDTLARAKYFYKHKDLHELRD